MRPETNQVLAEVWAKTAPATRRALSKKFDPDTAEDAVSQAIVELAAMLERGTAERPAALLNFIAFRRAVDTVRTFTRETEKAEQARLLSQPYLDPEDAFAPSAIDQGIRDLDESDRDAFILTELRGLTVHAAGAVSGVNYRTVHRRAERARARLQGALS